MPDLAYPLVLPNAAGTFIISWPAGYGNLTLAAPSLAGTTLEEDVTGTWVTLSGPLTAGGLLRVVKLTGTLTLNAYISGALPDPTLAARIAALEQQILSLDTVPPAVGLASSTTNVTTASSITLTAAPSDNIAVSKVEFYRASTLLTTRLVPPWTHTVALTSSDNGTVSFTARAFDSKTPIANSTVSNQVTVTVNIAATGTEIVELIEDFTSGVSGLTDLENPRNTALGWLWDNSGVSGEPGVFSSPTIDPGTQSAWLWIEPINAFPGNRSSGSIRVRFKCSTQPEDYLQIDDTLLGRMWQYDGLTETGWQTLTIPYGSPGSKPIRLTFVRGPGSTPGATSMVYVDRIERVALS